MRVIIVCAGTGGHIYPGIAVGEELQRCGDTVLFVGRGRGLERKVFPARGFNSRGIFATGLERAFSLKLFYLPGKLLAGFIQSLLVIEEFKPDWVMGTGGYVCGPLIMAARIAGIPTLIHEENVIPGLTNKILSYFVDRITISFPETAHYFPSHKTTFVGNPVRQEILNLIRSSALDRDRFTILILGGSLGAHRINLKVLEALEYLEAVKGQIQFFHLTGTNDFDPVKTTYFEKGFKAKVLPYLEAMEAAYKVSDLVICRAGASTISEITALGLPAILIPYPDATGGHQLVNAGWLVRKGAARAILDAELSGEKLAREVLDLFDHPDRLRGLSSGSKRLAHPGAAKEIANLIHGQI